MSAHQRAGSRLIVLGVVLALVLGGSLQPAAGAAKRLLLPIGGGYSDIYEGFSQAVLARAQNGQAKILVLPSAYASNAQSINEAERKKNIADAEERRFQIQEACKRSAQGKTTCQAVLAPIFVRADAEAADAARWVTEDLTAVFILGGDQTIAMQVLAGTPLESALGEAYQRGVIVAGTSAGGGMQAVTMLGGYQPNFAAETAMDFGAADVWNQGQRRGLPFSIRDAILDQHFHQRSRFGRLLNAIALPDVPHVGIGVDAYTGLQVEDETLLKNVFGLYTVTILDAETYHSADAVQYRGPGNTLSLRNVLVHLLAPGNFSYDLGTRRHSYQPYPSRLARNFDALKLPRGAGRLLLAGDLSSSLENSPVIDTFVQAAGGGQARLLLIVTGFPSEASARITADKYAAALGSAVEVQIIANDAQQAPPVPQGISGILVVGKDQARIQPALLQNALQAWKQGTPLLADNAAAAVMGAFYSAHAPSPTDPDELELATQKSFRVGRTQVQAGLKLVNIQLEPQPLEDNRWGRLFSLAYTHPQQVVFGISRATALDISADGAAVVGRNAVFALDLRRSALTSAKNEAFVIANGLLDVFAPGDAVQPETADVQSKPVRQPTPAIQQAAQITPTAAQGAQAPTAAAQIAPTATVQIAPTPTQPPAQLPTVAVPSPTAAPQPAIPGFSPLLIGAIAVEVLAIIGLVVWFFRRQSHS